MWAKVVASLGAIASCAAAPLGASNSAPLTARNNFPAGECVVDVKIELCHEYRCRLDGYHRIDAFLTQRVDADSWSYVFYKTEDEISDRCVTEIKVVEEGGKAPEGSGWLPSPYSAHEGVAEGGGPTLWSRRDQELQKQGKVVDLVVARPGRWANSTEQFTRSSVNLGLGEAAGELKYETPAPHLAASSGWVWLEYSVAGPRDPITDVKVVSCAGNSVASECGNDLLGKGWKRRDTDLNGPTANGSHVFIFTTTQQQDQNKCVTSLKVLEEETQATLPTNLNDGTDGNPLYLEVTQSSFDDCITSIRPIENSRYFVEPGHDVVLNDHGVPADVNAGIATADPIFIYTTTASERPKPESIELAFNSTGGFRILQFSDLHLSQHSAICLEVPKEIEEECSEEFTFRFIERALDLTKPDLVVVAGDLYSANTRKLDGKLYPLSTEGVVTKSLHKVVERGIPFAVNWGNHDSEGTLLREELQRAIDAQPGHVGSRGPTHLDGFGNFKLDIVKAPSSKETGQRLWFFDSQAYAYTSSGSGTGDYTFGQVEQPQIDWYKSNIDPDVNALAFFHIPVARISHEIGTNTSAIVGVHEEVICPQGHGCSNNPDLNDPYTPLFDALVSGGDVRATLSGHNHPNDYVIETGGIKMSYDGVTGYTAHSVINKDYNRQMRVIDITEFGKTASTFKIEDDILEGTIHRNEKEPVITLY